MQEFEQELKEAVADDETEKKGAEKAVAEKKDDAAAPKQ